MFTRLVTPLGNVSGDPSRKLPQIITATRFFAEVLPSTDPPTHDVVVPTEKFVLDMNSGVV
jgi:hypothetical protein